MNDGFQDLVKEDSLNTKARAFCSYTLWPDQTLAERIAPLAPTARIVILHPSAEGGMPHTRGPNFICLPAYYPESNLKTTIEHELVHLDQRKNPKDWEKRLLREGWRPISDETVPLEWRRRCRLNPDTAQSRFWIWKDRWIPMPVFIREDAPTLRDIETWWWDMKEEKASRQPPSSFQSAYGATSASEQEHPYELFAYRWVPK